KSLANYRSIACNLSAHNQSQKGGEVWNKWDANEFRLARHNYANWQWTARSSNRLTAKPKSRSIQGKQSQSYCDSGRDRFDSNEMMVTR
ncbi:hypothetical protein T12_5964, partial [Trichinella patagoniensis]